ncbi:lysoplasmalogenase [Robertmurraya sp. 2P01SA]|uniref:lysoplasmalogenase n=1 Tax=Robertmurraya sp. 2P01SA TaxID=3132300 RepID=UPI0039A5DA1B
MQRYRLPIFILLTSVFYIFIIPSDPEALKILCKLIPMWLILIYAYKQIRLHQSRTLWIIWWGLFFCMLGDGLISRWFILGLLAFLIGHLIYIAGFFRFRRLSSLALIVILPLGVYGVVMGYHVLGALLEELNYSLALPVFIYLLVILFMCWMAFLTRNAWVIVGSILFVISDSFLSWNMFVSAVPHSDIFIMTTYYAAQFLIAHSLRFFPKT